MAIASLTRFTVPLATNQSATSQGLLMPKMKYRFRAIFENFGVSTDRVEMTKQVADISRPNVNFNPFVVEVYNSKVNLVGKPSWEPVTINLRDDAGGNVSKLVGEQIQKQFDFAEQSSASSGIDYKFVLKFEMLDGSNGASAKGGRNSDGVLETWELYGAFLTSVNYGEMNYGTSEAAMISLSVTYDNAVQTPSGTGVGTAVGRTLGTLITG
jgi:hypothetical protein